MAIFARVVFGMCYMTALTIPMLPLSAATYTALGTSLKGEGKPAQATDAYRQAFLLEPDRPEVAYNLGTTLHEGNRIDEAIDYYRLALRLRPIYPEAANNLATALKEQGRLDEAVAQYRAILALSPEHALPYYNLSELAAAGHYRFTPEELARVQNLRSSPRLSAQERSFCAFTLATIHAQEGAYDQAFAHYQEANQLQHGLLKARGQSFDAGRHEALINRIIAIHDRGYFRQVAGWGTDTELPVFIIGMPRSGTTLVEQILASHPRVFGAGELGEVPNYLAFLAEEAPAGQYAGPVFTSPRIARAVATDYLARMTQLAQGAGRVTIKALDNFLHLGLLATLFPRARVIHCRRDPLDVCLSCYFQNFHDMRFAWSLDDIGAYHRCYRKLMAHWANVLPVPIHDVVYEDLVHNQEKVTRDLLTYCGLDWDPRCLEFHATRRVVRTASAVQVRNPISARAIGRWKHYRAHLQPLFEALREPDGKQRKTPPPQGAASLTATAVPHSYLG